MILHLVENKTDIQNKIKNEKKNNKETDELRKYIKNKMITYLEMNKKFHKHLQKKEKKIVFIS